MKRWRYGIQLILVAMTLMACAHTVDLLDRVQIGMEREQTIRNVSSNPSQTIKQAGTEYLLYTLVTSVSQAYSNTHSVLFVRLENGRVVDKGVVGRGKAAEIKKLAPWFDLDEAEGRRK